MKPEDYGKWTKIYLWGPDTYCEWKQGHIYPDPRTIRGKVRYEHGRYIKEKSSIYILQAYRESQLRSKLI